MEYEDLVEEPEFTPPDQVAEVDIVTPDPPKQGASWKAVILTGLLAGLVGAGGGAAAVYFGLKTQTPDMTAVKADLQRSLAGDLSSLEDRISAAEATANQAIDRPISTPSPVSVDLTPLEDRIVALETAPSPEIDPEALTALQAAQADGFEWPDTTAIDEKLTAIEARMEESSGGGVSADMLLEMADRIDALESQSSAGVKMPTDLMTRLEALETASTLKTEPKIPAGLMARIKALESKPAPKAEKEVIPLLAFPKVAMIKVVEDTAEGGFVARTLSKHVRVKDEDDPRSLIEGIEADLSEGRLDLAANKYDRLPSPVQEAGRAWYNSLKAAQ